MLSFFSGISSVLEEEGGLRENIRETVKDLEKTCRIIAAELNSIHSNTTESFINEKSDAALAHFAQFRDQVSKLASLVPADQYYRYCNMWSFTMQNAVFLAALVTYLKSEQLMDTMNAEKILGVPVDLKSDIPTFHISIEEYLHGIITLTSELTRLSINSVTSGDFQRPIRVHKFISDLHSGFQLLSLKNDSLRKRFDGLKYEVKRVEEIVYDISVRGLVSGSAAKKDGEAVSQDLDLTL
ncbi:hypothetical protein HDU76_004193 [Blyttiomyces sp. JEL0837]|nr:hypothetical protein HDU76_004193 [Blyttiomyces sp. JEL0837]